MNVDDDVIIKAHRIYHTYLRPTSINLPKAVEEGMIPKGELEDGVTYQGYCRNAYTAVWKTDQNRFEYIRYKFGYSFPELIPHPADDVGYDVFVPVRKVMDG